ncbi:MAG: M28 family peptidase [Balneolaceae bacterium]|nr:MAG: M28 family peptidase [Balneolaceae bacterium]
MQRSCTVRQDKTVTFMDHRQRRKWQPLISFGIAALLLALFFFITIGTWKMIMPSTTRGMQIPEPTPDELKAAEQLQKDVRFLASDIGERNVFRAGTMDRTVEWLLMRFEETGYQPVIQEYSLRGTARNYDQGVSKNIIAEISGYKKPDKILVIGAHYDSVYGSPGANDNASGIAVLISLAKYFSGNPQQATLRFVAFANEEPPFFQTVNMGSYAYAELAAGNKEQIFAMIALDGLGYFSESIGSQKYPVPGIGLVYPKTANFIGFVTRFKDMSLLRKATEAFRKKASIPSEAAALPSIVPGAAWSDHWSFWQHGFPGLLITDTLLFRDSAYHTAHDTPERLDYENMARVVIGLREVIKDLAN